ncbi:hypothetical protein ACPA9J_01680 [Pseudomonas aeruginosa]
MTGSLSIGCKAAVIAKPGLPGSIKPLSRSSRNSLLRLSIGGPSAGTHRYMNYKHIGLPYPWKNLEVRATTSAARGAGTKLFSTKFLEIQQHQGRN